MNIDAGSMIRFLLIGICLVAIATGLNVIFQGISGIPESGLVSQASIDNELRFMAVFWVAFGIYCFAISRSIQKNKRNILYVAVVFFCSGLARLLSCLTVGEPIPLFIGAMVLELCLPIVIFALVRQVSRKEHMLQQV